MTTYNVATTGLDTNNGTSSAFATPAKASSVVANGDIITLHAGTYHLASAINISSKSNITIQTAGDGDVTLSGGVVVSGWSIYDAPNNIWRANCTTATRNLFVNGVRATRSSLRWQGTGTADTATTITTTNGFLNALKNPTQIELIFRNANIWKEMRCPIVSVAVTTINMPSPGWGYIRTVNSVAGTANTPWAVENVWEIFLSDLIPGSFYYDPSGAVNGTQGIYYIPRPGENMATVLTTVANLQQILICDSLSNCSIGGSVGSRLILSDTQWLQPGSTNGFAEVQANAFIQGSYPTRDSIMAKPLNTLALTNCSNMTIKRVTFTHCGTACLGISTASSNVEVAGCAFLDNSGNWMVIGDSSERHPATQTTGVNVHDNIVDSWGQEFHGATGLLHFYSLNCTISQNQISNGPYAGMQIGWGWDQNTSIFYTEAPTGSPGLSGPYEVGMEFQTTVACNLIGFRFYKATGDTGPHTSNLWAWNQGANTGTIVASATYSNETPNGWQEVRTAAAVPLTPGTAYIVSRNIPSGNPAYATDAYFYQTGNNPKIWGPLQSIAQPSDGSNGRFHGAVGAFPDAWYNAGNYWVDVLIDNSTGNITVSNNKILNTMKEMGDGGGIYTNGYSRGTTITGNVIGNVGGPLFDCGVYIDEGGINNLFQNNVIYGVDRWNTINTLQTGQSASANLSGNYVDIIDGATGDNTHLSSDPRSAAPSIVAAAGITSTYADALSLLPNRTTGRIFNDSNRGSRITGAISALGTSGTVSMWINPSNSFDMLTGVDYVFLHLFNGTAHLRIGLLNDQNLHSGFFDTAGANQELIWTPTKALWKHNTWMLVTFTWSPSASIMYVNGTMVASRGATTVLSVGTSLNLGNLDSNFGSGFPGFSLAHVALWNRVITSGEIQSLLTKSPRLINNGLTSYWSLSEDTKSFADPAGGKILTASLTANSLLAAPALTISAGYSLHPSTFSVTDGLYPVVFPAVIPVA